MTRTVLVTGAAGFIGAALSQRLRQRGDRVGIAADEGAGVAGGDRLCKGFGDQPLKQGFRLGYGAVKERQGVARLLGEPVDHPAYPRRIVHAVSTSCWCAAAVAEALAHLCLSGSERLFYVISGAALEKAA